MIKEQKIITDGIIHNNGKFLILKRSSKEKIFPNKWELPSGKVEFGEDPNKTIIREIYEETGIKSDKVKLHRVKHHTFKSKGKLRHNIQLLFVLKSNNKKIKLSRAHEDFAWITINELNNFDVFEDIPEILIKAKKQLK